MTAVEAPTDAIASHALTLGTRDVAIVTLPPLTVREDVAVETVRVEASTGTAVLLAARLTSGPAAGGATCAAAFPPASWGATVPAEGAALGAGDRASLVLYLRPGGARAVVDQVVVRYAHGDEHEELRWNAVRLDLTPARSAHTSC